MGSELGSFAQHGQYVVIGVRRIDDHVRTQGIETVLSHITTGHGSIMLRLKHRPTTLMYGGSHVGFVRVDKNDAGGLGGGGSLRKCDFAYGQHFNVHGLNSINHWLLAFIMHVSCPWSAERVYKKKRNWPTNDVIG